MSNVESFTALCALVGAGYYGFGIYATLAFARARRNEQQTLPTPTPPVTLLKPLKGLGVDLDNNLDSFCRLDYPSYQILFAVADPRDPAIAVVERLQRRFPQRDIEIIVDPRQFGANRKASNLIHMMERAKHDILVISDSDIRVPADYLRRIVQPFEAADVGLVTCLYRGVPSRSGSTRMEALFVNTDFMPMVFVAQQVEKFRYAFGATIAIRREALNAIGGFRAIADHLADDYELGFKVTARGYRAVLSSLIVETHLDAETWSSLARHQLRWARTYRVCRPGGYFATIITHGTSWATLCLLVSGFSTIGWQIFLATVSIRLIEAAIVGAGYMGSRETFRDLWMVPIKDWLLTLLWIASYFGNEVEWGGERLTVAGDGRMRAVLTVDAPTIKVPTTEEPSLEPYSLSVDSADAAVVDEPPYPETQAGGRAS